MSVLAPTPRDRLLDAQGRPYFLWDLNVTLEEFLRGLRTGDSQTRAYLAGKLLRQAKPDDVFEFLTLREIRESWPELVRHLGRSRGFWRWILDAWAKEAGD